MSDLAATNCQNTRNNGCDCGSGSSFSNCLLPLLLICCCGGGSSHNSDCGCGNGCDILWLIILLSFFGCGNGFNFNCGCGNGCNMGSSCCWFFIRADFSAFQTIFLLRLLSWKRQGQKTLSFLCVNVDELYLFAPYFFHPKKHRKKKNHWFCSFFLCVPYSWLRKILSPSSSSRRLFLACIHSGSSS